MKKITITKKVFRTLLASIEIKAYKNGAKPTAKAAKWFGFNRYHDYPRNPYSIKAKMLTDKKIVNFLFDLSEADYEDKQSIEEDEKLAIAAKKLNGKYLYNLKNSLGEKGGKSSDVIAGRYAHLYLTFLKYENFDHFLDDINEQIDSNFFLKQIDLEELELSVHSIKKLKLSKEDKDIQRALLHPSLNNNYRLSFDGYYFNQNTNLIGDFSVEIHYLNNYFVKQEGFHLSSSVKNSEEEFSRNLTYTGYGTPLEKFFHCNLKPLEGENFIDMVLYTAGGRIENLSSNYIRGILTTFSSHGYILTTEIILVKKNLNDKSLKRKLSLHLSWRKKSFKVQGKKASSNTISINDTYLRGMTKMVGKWRIWSLISSADKKPVIYQSVFTINKDFTATLEVFSSKDVETLACDLQVVEGSGKGGNNGEIRRGMNLVVHAYSLDDKTFRNLALIEIPIGIGDDTLTTGFFCGVDYFNNNFVNSPISLLKDARAYKAERISHKFIFLKLAQGDNLQQNEFGYYNPNKELPLARLYENLKKNVHYTSKPELKYYMQLFSALYGSPKE